MGMKMSKCYPSYSFLFQQTLYVSYDSNHKKIFIGILKLQIYGISPT